MLLCLDHGCKTLSYGLIELFIRSRIFQLVMMCAVGLKFKNGVFQKITYLGVPGIFQWGNASCISVLSKSLKNDVSPKMMFFSFRALRFLNSPKMMDHFTGERLYSYKGGILKWNPIDG